MSQRGCFCGTRLARVQSLDARFCSSLASRSWLAPVSKTFVKKREDLCSYLTYLHPPCARTPPSPIDLNISHFNSRVTCGSHIFRFLLRPLRKQRSSP